MSGKLLMSYMESPMCTKVNEWMSEVFFGALQLFVS
jgi:hypothetical protein